MEAHGNPVTAILPNEEYVGRAVPVGWEVKLKPANPLFSQFKHCLAA